MDSELENLLTEQCSQNDIESDDDDDDDDDLGFIVSKKLVKESPIKNLDYEDSSDKDSDFKDYRETNKAKEKVQLIGKKRKRAHRVTDNIESEYRKRIDFINSYPKSSWSKDVIAERKSLMKRIYSINRRREKRRKVSKLEDENIKLKDRVKELEAQIEDLTYENT